jgi:two-component system cell cycle sensor histidine kinase/response regulator CckA
MGENGASDGGRLLEALFHAHSGIKLLLDPADGRIVDANPAAVAFYGYPRERLLSMHISDINEMPPQEIAVNLGRAAARDASAFEFRHRLASGVVRDVAVNSSPVEVDGRTLLFSILHDITDRKDAERALRSAQAYQRALFEGAQDAIVVAAPDGRILDVNRRAEALFGRDRRTLLAMNQVDLYAEVDRPAARARFAARAHGLPPPGGDLMVMQAQRPDGTLVPLEIAGNRLALGDGTEVLLGVFRDVSQRHASEHEVRRLSQIIEQSPVAIMVTDLRGVITWVNAAFTTLTGFAADEVVGQTPRLLKSPETPGDVHAHLWATISAGRTWRGELVNRRKSGETYRETMVVAPLLGADGRPTHYVAVKEDVSERRRLEEDLRQAQRLEAVGQLAGGVAHDFNNLLAVQQMNVSLLLRRADLSPGARELVLELEQGAQLAADVTRKLLAFSRKQSLQKRIVSLDALVAEMAKLLTRVVPENITLEHVRESGPTWVNVDVGAAEQTVMNLVLNARDAMPQGGTITLAAAPTDNGRTVTLSVRDTGHGIEPQALPHIFEPFFTTRPSGRGTGLGLATVYGLVTQHGGVVEVDSTPGRGTTFRLRFPASSPPTEETPAAPAPTATSAAPRRRVLLVEDSADVRRAFARVLASLGCDVVEAQHAADALGQWGELRGSIDVLFTDVVMPGELSGVQLARRLREEQPDLFVIIASGYSGELTRDLEPDFHFLAKPFTSDVLRQVLSRAPARAAR